jgi:hypothetical protein
MFMSAPRHKQLDDDAADAMKHALPFHCHDAMMQNIDEQRCRRCLNSRHTSKDDVDAMVNSLRWLRWRYLNRWCRLFENVALMLEIFLLFTNMMKHGNIKHPDARRASAMRLFIICFALQNIYLSI